MTVSTAPYADWGRPVVARLLLLEAACWAVIVAIGGMQQWVSVEVPSSIDLVSYLDVGDAWMQGHWATAINGYWNPLYSWILGFVLAVVHPGPRLEYPVAEAVDFAIFLFALASFAWLLRGARVAAEAAAWARGDDRAAIPGWAWIVGGYTLFGWASIRWITLSSNTPDMLGAAMIYLACGVLLRLDEARGLRPYLLLGATLGLAYLARTPYFLVACIIFLVTGWQARSAARRRGLLVAGLVFLGLSLPFVTAVSIARGHPTIGDNGRLNHAWLANPRPGLPNRYWQGGPPGYGTPVHPVRVLWKAPEAYEFSTPVGGTYPAWTDPSYWYEGLTYRFNARAEWDTLRNNAYFYRNMFARAMLFAVAVVLLVGGHLGKSGRAFARYSYLWMPAVVGLALYLVAADLHVQRLKLQPPQRYLAAFVVMLALALALSFRARRVRFARVLRAIAATALIGVGVAAFWVLARDARADLRAPRGLAPWKVARALQAAGLPEGASVATIGRPDRHEYWARLSRVRIIADVPYDDAFWKASPEVRQAVLDRLARTGARAAVAWWTPPGPGSAGWETAPGTTYAIRWLNR